MKWLRKSWLDQGYYNIYKNKDNPEHYDVYTIHDKAIIINAPKTELNQMF